MRTTALALLLAACGGPATGGTTSAEASGACDFGEDREEMRSEGSRVVVSLPRGFERRRGLLVYAHACGAAVMIGEAPAHLEPEQRTAFAAGILLGVLETARARGMECTEVEPMTRWSCVGEGEAQEARLLTTDAGKVAAVARGPIDAEVAASLVHDVRFDLDAPYDGLAAMGLQLDPIPGLHVAAESYAGAVDFVGSGGNEAPAPLMAWRFVSWTAHPAHRDGSTWEDGEIGEVGGELAVNTLSLTAADESSMRLSELAPGRLELTFDAEAGGAAVAVYLASIRAEGGVFYALARAPAESAGTWIVSFRGHVTSAR